MTGKNLSDGTCQRRVRSNLKEQGTFDCGILKDAGNGGVEEYRGFQILLPVSRPLLI